MNNTNLSDIWRIANPTGREYNFYSAMHNSDILKAKPTVINWKRVLWLFGSSDISLYFDTIDNSETTPSTLWEVFKAFLRGSTISFEAYRRKKIKAKLLELDNQINLLNKETVQTPSNELHKKN